MKGIFLSLFVSAALTSYTLAQQDVPGVKVPNSSLLRSTIPGDCAVNGGIVCSSCTALSLCINGAPAAEIECSGNFPYCNPTDVPQPSCSATPATGCGTNTSTAPQAITCSSVGILPDPNNCNNYHVCRQGVTTSDVYVCPTGTSFNLATLQCRAQNANNCVRIQCNNTASGFVYYGTSRQYYAYCAVANGVATPYMLKCPNRATFNMNTFSCTYNCPGQGNFVNSNDPATYYQCYILNGRWVATVVRCPANTTFNQTLTYCV
ncbi:uncharacterized protein LOC131689957 [Topomyia yanbarensis]|uniref:uncharacterized protein LOC131689957 n=1 Tax=Topomyia yanbarensis TaxID=2498891 RepID=UPI00273B8D23|nr:uncharacterized protein LOC131689957 [Topomyia yanbarensis]